MVPLALIESLSADLYLIPATSVLGTILLTPLTLDQILERVLCESGALFSESAGRSACTHVQRNYLGGRDNFPDPFTYPAGSRGGICSS